MFVPHRVDEPHVLGHRSKYSSQVALYRCYVHDFLQSLVYNALKDSVRMVDEFNWPAH